MIHNLAGRLTPQSELIDVPSFIGSCYELKPDSNLETQLVAFGTSGHRGNALNKSLEKSLESHIMHG